MAIIIRGNGVTLPSPVAVTASDEIIWSANTGRSSAGRMLGDAVAEKKTFTVEWGVLTRGEMELIRSSLRSGFHPFTIVEDGVSTTVTSYRGALTGTVLGCFGGVTYYKDVSVTVIQQ